MMSAMELRALARVERNPRKRVRLLAIANVRDGMAVEVAARAGGMGRATLYRWLARERPGGPAALGDHPRSGRRRKLDAEQRADRGKRRPQVQPDKDDGGEPPSGGSEAIHCKALDIGTRPPVRRHAHFM